MSSAAKCDCRTGRFATLGEHDIEIHLHSDVNVSVRINVVPDGELVDEPILADDGVAASDVTGETPRRRISRRRNPRTRLALGPMVSAIPGPDMPIQ